MDARYVDSFLFQELGQPIGGGGGVVAADGHQYLDVVAFEKVGTEFFVGRFVTAHYERRTAPAVDVVGRFEIEIDEIGFVAHEAFVAAVESDHFVAVLAEYLGHGADDRIDARRRPPCAEYGYCIFHNGLGVSL